MKLCNRSTKKHQNPGSRWKRWDAEDQRFKNILEEIGEYTAPSGHQWDEARELARKLGFRCSSAVLCLGGLGSGFANNGPMIDILDVAFNNNGHVIIDKSLKGWKE